MADGSVQIDVRSTGQFAKGFNEAAPRQAMEEDFRTVLGPDIEDVFKIAAPVRTGRLRDSISAEVGGGGAGAVTITVTGGAVSEDGTPYMDITRFGRGPIVATGPTLRWEGDGGVVYRRFVPAWEPGRDWAEPAIQASDRLVSAAEPRIGRKMEALI